MELRGRFCEGILGDSLVISIYVLEGDNCFLGTREYGARAGGGVEVYLTGRFLLRGACEESLTD